MSATMITPGEARKIIEQNVEHLPAISISLSEAVGLTLADDIYASSDIPAFPQSSVDGYAIAFNEWQAHQRLKLEGRIQAGDNNIFQLATGTAVRIFTGAPVPPGADTVVMQEKVKLDTHVHAGGQLSIEDPQLRLGSNVRPQGSEIKAGALALEKDSFLSPAAIGFLAGIGTEYVSVYREPVISIIVTGNELQQPGRPLGYGQVYESNAASLNAVLQQLYFKNIRLHHVEDDESRLTSILNEALLHSDLVLLTGGVSVGEYDFVIKAASACGVVQLFHKVKQKPGKPLYFGKKESKVIFGLPGNPSSVLTCFYEYVIAALKKMNKRIKNLHVLTVPLVKPFSRPAGLTHFLKGAFDGKVVHLSDAQESYRMSSFAKANCLVKIDEHITELKAGEMVEIHLLPH